jgi:multicomponent Na+:H+ antiporter subunit B
MEREKMMSERSEILTKMIGFLFPFIIIFGVYIILNGHKTPGGGFQGGAVLSALFISRYLIAPVNSVKLGALQTIEKAIFVLVLAIPTFFIFSGFNYFFPIANICYLIIMNSLIGIKVCCGLSIIFFRFVFYESR